MHAFVRGQCRQLQCCHCGCRQPEQDASPLCVRSPGLCRCPAHRTRAPQSKRARWTAVPQTCAVPEVRRLGQGRLQERTHADCRAPTQLHYRHLISLFASQANLGCTSSLAVPGAEPQSRSCFDVVAVFKTRRMNATGVRGSPGQAAQHAPGCRCGQRQPPVSLLSFE